MRSNAPAPKDGPRVNEEIRVREVQLIDASGHNHGPTPIQAALDAAQAAGLDLVEIAPTAHYSMGGIWVHPDNFSTGIEGLYAVGEASSGLHGANRLGGNSLVELIVCGRIVGEAASRYSSQLIAPQR